MFFLLLNNFRFCFHSSRWFEYFFHLCSCFLCVCFPKKHSKLSAAAPSSFRCWARCCPRRATGNRWRRGVSDWPKARRDFTSPAGRSHVWFMTVSVSTGRASSCQVNIISVSGVCLVIDCNTHPDIGRLHFQYVHHSERSNEAGEERVASLSLFLFTHSDD